MSAPVGPEHRLRSWALTVAMVAIACWLGARLIVAAAPILMLVGAAAALLWIVWAIVRRRRW